jgi:hypothetical protein
MVTPNSLDKYHLKTHNDNHRLSDTDILNQFKIQVATLQTLGFLLHCDDQSGANTYRNLTTGYFSIICPILQFPKDAIIEKIGTILIVYDSETVLGCEMKQPKISFDQWHGNALTIRQIF